MSFVVSFILYKTVKKQILSSQTKVLHRVLITVTFFYTNINSIKSKFFILLVGDNTIND